MIQNIFNNSAVALESLNEFCQKLANRLAGIDLNKKIPALEATSDLSESSVKNRALTPQDNQNTSALNFL